jgi:hypothetical protein
MRQRGSRTFNPNGIEIGSTIRFGISKTAYNYVSNEYQDCGRVCFDVRFVV